MWTPDESRKTLETMATMLETMGCPLHAAALRHELKTIPVMDVEATRDVLAAILPPLPRLQ